MTSANSSIPLRPFVLINMAMSADGKIATAGREVTTFGSPRDLEHLYELRATADAILCGARTIEETGATLGNGGEKFRRRRLKAGLAEYPVRVVVTGRGTISPEAALWTKHTSPIVVLTTSRIPTSNRQWLEERAAEVWISPGEELDFPAALRHLRKRYGIGRLLSEGGAKVNDGLFRARVVDEINLTICPYVFGGQEAPTIAEGIGIEHLADAAQFRLVSRRKIRDEMYAVYSAVPSAQ
ncbi:MAG TPA: dihydrofolate reductase family protein [Candidatus Limnocylindria bacterium]|nr:dihydrofolate reductase family protein [Candidatus Limnocylindria bacterium]